MKKLLLGLLIGMVLMIPCVSFADDAIQMIGKNVDGTLGLKINTKTTGKRVIDIEGTGYISVRDVAELLGYDTYYNDNDKEVDLIAKDYDVAKHQQDENERSVGVITR